ncbi:tyrosine--tRNA ligase [candidate division WWE3 bacterium]|uniref:Tyrosine--tRNA ligase n=1 Tax=candidate division WWE3 bacterium TaxID=2053526 RepID=A0A7X9DKX6_UNCKA|nr:tyrosine--tRNA ligase [candidate division WWE3 bacterium]
MNKVLVDKELIEEFINRGVENIFPSKEDLRKKLYSGERLKAYQGYDPTGPYLHVGHAMGIRGLRILQKLGHEVIFLVGDFTAKVGDPDKDSARKMLTDEEIEKNMAGWKTQAAQLIDFEGENPVQFKRNYEWLSKLQLQDLIKLMANATVQQMMERDLFDKRLKRKDPIGLQEFIYPLMQGYDSVAMGVDLEIGGADQTFNMLMGRTLVKNYLGKEKFVRSNIMMEAPDGITMSKTKGNGINLGDSPENMYGKAMSYSDELLIKALLLLTELPLKEIDGIDHQIKAGENPMKFKKLMAFEIVKMLKGVESATKAQEHFEKTVQNREISSDLMEKIHYTGKITVQNLLKECVKENSSSQIKRTIEQGGVEINGGKVIDPFSEVDIKSGDVIKYGKRKYFRVE